MRSSASHHLPLDLVVSKKMRLSDDLLMWDLEHSRYIADLSTIYKIRCNHGHVLEAALSTSLELATMTFQVS